jgi:hypothetical protein
MAPRTRAKRPMEDETYTSTAPVIQKRFPNRRKAIKTYGSAARKREKRQTTLTQIDFTTLRASGEIEDCEEDEPEIEEDERPKKRRKSSRSKGDDARDRSIRQSTLTQIDFVRRWKVQDSEDEGLLSEENEDRQGAEELEPHPGTNEIDIEADHINAPEDTSHNTAAIERDEDSARNHITDSGPETINTHERKVRHVRNPQTPKRVRVLAVPSSQTPPTTPLTTQQTPRQPESGNPRSPLQQRSINDLVTKESTPKSPVVAESPTKQRATESPAKRRITELSAIQEATESPPKQRAPDSSPNILAIESPTKQRAREFRARMDELRNGCAFRQPRHGRVPFRPDQVIRPSTGVSLETTEGDKEGTERRAKTGESQFAIGEETQAILVEIDLACGHIDGGDVDAESEIEDSEPGYTGDKEINLGDKDLATNKEENVHEDESVEVLDLTQEPDDDEPELIHHSPELPFESYDDEERVPSTQNSAPRSSRRRHIIFSDDLHIPRDSAPMSTTPKASIEAQESTDPVSAQLLRETQLYADLVPSSPLFAPPPPSTHRPRFQEPINPQSHDSVRISQATTTDVTQTQPPSTSLPDNPQSSSKYGPKDQSHILIPSSPQQQQQVASSPIPASTPGIFRFLRGPITVSQLIPESLRGGGADSIGLPPRWTQDSGAEEMEDDDDEL